MLHDVAQHYILMGERNTILRAKNATRYNNNNNHDNNNNNNNNNNSVLAFGRCFQ